jgi:hypothetical protein
MIFFVVDKVQVDDGIIKDIWSLAKARGRSESDSHSHRHLHGYRC